jgi:hypothetical protein
MPIPSPQQVAGIPVLAGATSPPGAPLGDGFVVPDGTVLVATPLPAEDDATFYGEPVIDDGWRALLLLTGDPSDTLRSMLRQAAERDLRLSEAVCSASDLVFKCRQVFGRLHGGRLQELRVHVARTLDDAPEPASEVVLVYTDRVARSTDTELFDPHPRGVDASGRVTVVVPSVPTDWRPLELEGALLDLRYGEYPPLRIERGTDLASPLWSGRCDGFLAILDVRGHPRDVLNAYDRQLTDAFGIDSGANLRREVQTRRDGDATILELDHGNDDLGISLSLVMRSSVAPWLFIETCPTT